MKAALFLSLFAALASAIDYEEHILSFNVSEVSSLVSISSDINTTGLLPGYEYAYNLTIAWAVPNTALRNINASSVAIFIKIRPRANETNVYFRDPSLGTNETIRFFTLRCPVENSSCASSSVLVRKTSVFYFLTPGANISQEQFLITAQLVPFANESEITRANESLQRINGTNETLLLQTAQQRFEDGDYNTTIALAEAVAARMHALATPMPLASATPEPSERQSLDQLLAGINPFISGGILLVILLGLLFLALRKSSKQPRNVT